MNEESIFMEALQKQTPQERADYLDQVCGSNPELRHSVEMLLKAHDKAGHFLHGGPPIDPTIDQANREAPGTIIGPYKLLQQIGEGGMGTVFMAEQMHPVQRRVALKVIKPGMDSRQVITRFEAERQALAMMDHVNIARVLDAGATESGRPYFVMELVHGIPITKYCDDNHLTPRERLELFVPVCQAIQHAHQKGIIHRDIKPSNVMITLYDGKPVPKVIDFGVAKATEQKLTERTLFTQYGTMVGTLEYMSPEQAEMSALGVDTRSDIYSLGVLLYELLTGSTPLSHKRMKEAAYGEILRMIKEEDPPKPSTRLSDSGEALASISAQRKTEPAKLSKLMRGELDWIVMKTLEKDRNRRYETANGFAADVKRYLNDETVQACPPSAMYRLRKLARRNKRLLVAVGFMVTALLLGTLVSTWQAIRATQAEEVSQKRLEAEQEARREAHEAGEEFFTRVSENRLLDEPGLQPLRKELLEAAVTYYERLAAHDSDDPDGQADLTVASLRLAQIYYQTGFYDRHVAALDQGLGLVDKLIREHPDSADLHLRLAGFWHGGRNLLDGHHTDMKSALQVYQTAVALWEKLGERYPAVSGFQSDLSKFYDLQGNTQREVGQYEEALRTEKKVCEIREQIVRANPGIYEHVAELAHAYVSLAQSLEVSDPQAAEKLYRQAVTLEKEAPDVASYQQFLAVHQGSLGRFLARQRRPDEATQAMQQAVDIYGKLAARFPHMSNFRTAGASWKGEVNALRPDTNRSNQDSPQERHPREEALASLKSLKTEDAPAALHAAARLYHQDGDACLAGNVPQATQKAEKTYRTAIVLFEKLAAGEPTAIGSEEELADCYYKLGELLMDKHPQQAEKLFRQALPIRRKLVANSPGHAGSEMWLALTLHRIAFVLRGSGQLEEARQLLEEAIEHQPVGGHRQWHYYDLALVLLLHGEHRQAAKAAADLVQDAPDDAGRQLQAADFLARCMYLAENDVKLSKADRKCEAKVYGDRAKEHAQRAIVLSEKLATELPNIAKHRRELAKSRFFLGSLLWAGGRRQEGEKELRIGLDLDESAVNEAGVSAGDRLGLADQYVNLGHALAATGHPKQAEPEYRRALAITEKLTAESTDDPANWEYLAGTTNNLGVLLAASGQYPEAEQAFRKALGIQEKRAAESPKRPYFRQELAGSHFNLGMVLAATGRGQDAERAFLQALTIRENLLSEVPESDWQGPFGLARVYTGLFQTNIDGRHFSHSALANTLHQLAKLSRNRSQLADAERLLQRAIEQEQEALEFYPTSTNYRRFLLNMYAETLQTLIHLEDKPEARKECTPSFSDVWEEYYRAAGSLAGCGSLVEKDDDLYPVERKALAQVCRERTRELLQGALKRSNRHPVLALQQNNLAWLLVTRPELELRDPAHAVELAKKAVELAPKEGNHWNTLGVAHYRAGDWKAAVTALDKSMELSKGGDGNDWFLLAMVSWRLGDKEQARNWYRQAIQWMDKNKPQDEELRRFRAEAAELLQLAEPPKEGGVPTKEEKKSPSKK